MPSKRLFLVDAYALIFRGYYAFIKNPRINSKGMDTSAILGFMNALLDLIRREKPDLLAVAFDKGGSDERNALYDNYKSNRLETPEAILLAIPYIHRILQAMGIPVIEKEGYEADDLIGTLAKQAEKKSYTTYMVTPDKDFAQLVSEKTFLYKPSRMGNGVEIWGIPEVQQKFEVEHPRQVIDFLGMMGDPVDNIPGLPGVGEKTAKKFIKQFGSLENLLENTHELKGKIKEKIEANKDLGLLSKRLATIITDAPVTFHEEDFHLSKPNMKEVKHIFDELEFRRMWETFARLFQQDETAGSSPRPPESAGDNAVQLDLFSDAAQPGNHREETTTGFLDIQTVDHHYQYIHTLEGCRLLVRHLLEQENVSIDTETTGLNPLTAELVGISFSYEKGKAYYVPIPPERDKALEILEVFRPFFENTHTGKTGQNIKYDMKVLRRYGVEIKGKIFDTMIAHYLLQPEGKHSLDRLAERYLNYRMVPIESLIGKKGKKQGSMRDVPLDEITEYACEDADICLQLRIPFTERLEEMNMHELFYRVEIPLIRVLADMEMTGVALDTGYLEKLTGELEKDIHALEEKIFRQTGKQFNLASPKQLGDVLFGEMRLLEKPKKTKTGQYATGEEILSKLAFSHPVVADILEWRGLVKLKNTYTEALPKEINPGTGRLHTTFLQTATATGRLSSVNPNIQNIPIRTERGRLVRKAFVPRSGEYRILSADYSQIELRIIAELSGDPVMLESFRRGEDIHRATAAKVFNVPMEKVTREQRSHAKTVNFGIIYGVSAYGLTQQTNLSRKEAQALIDAYYRTYPKLRDYIRQQVDFAREHGYVETLLGRRRYLRDINSRNHIVRARDERNAVNAPIQGSAADFIKLAMIRIYEFLEKGNFRTKMLLQIHDELVFELHKDEADTLIPGIIEIMENVYPLHVPLKVDFGVGNNWLEAH